MNLYVGDIGAAGSSPGWVPPWPEVGERRPPVECSEGAKSSTLTFGPDPSLLGVIGCYDPRTFRAFYDETGEKRVEIGAVPCRTE